MDILDIDSDIRTDLLDLIRHTMTEVYDRVEIGIKCDDEEENVNYLLLDGTDEDLFDFMDLNDLEEIDLDPASEFGLDFYVYYKDELLKNVRIITKIDADDTYSMRLDSR